MDKKYITFYNKFIRHSKTLSDCGVAWNHFWSVYSCFCLAFTHSLRYRQEMKFITCAETSNRGFLILMS